MSISPNLHSFAHGSNRAWVLHDGTFLYSASAIALGAPASELTRLLGAALRPDGQIELSVNVMLVQWGGELIMIDAGCGTAYGPNLGHKERALREAGFDVGDVTAIVFTHLHLDHIAGAIDAATRRLRFPSARLFALRDEYEFWRQPHPLMGTSALPVEQREALVRNIHETLDLFEPKLELFAQSARLFDGFTAELLPGHTPYHSGFWLQSEGQRILNSGDAFSDPRLHVPHPEWAQIGDAQPEVATATRHAICTRMMREEAVIFGAHFAFPGLGQIHGNDEEKLMEKMRTPLAPFFVPSN